MFYVACALLLFLHLLSQPFVMIPLLLFCLVFTALWRSTFLLLLHLHLLLLFPDRSSNVLKLFEFCPLFTFYLFFLVIDLLLSWDVYETFGHVPPSPFSFPSVFSPPVSDALLLYPEHNMHPNHEGRVLFKQRETFNSFQRKKKKTFIHVKII